MTNGDIKRPLSFRPMFDPVSAFIERGFLYELSSPGRLLKEPDYPISLKMTLASAENATQARQAVDKMEGTEEDPFEAGRHFHPVPCWNGPHSVTFSVLFAIGEKEARGILKTPGHRSGTLELHDDFPKLQGPHAIVGYATLRVHLQSSEEAAIQAELDDDDLPEEERDPRHFYLSLDPDAFFMTKAVRGRGYGRLSGSILAQCTVDALYSLGAQASIYGERLRIEPLSDFQIHSSGGEAAVDEFIAEWLMTADDFSMTEDDTGLQVDPITVEGGI